MEKNINFNLNKQTLANFISFLPFGFGAILCAKLAIEILYVKPEYVTFLFLFGLFWRSNFSRNFKTNILQTI